MIFVWYTFYMEKNTRESFLYKNKIILSIIVGVLLVLFGFCFGIKYVILQKHEPVDVPEPAKSELFQETKFQTTASLINTEVVSVEGYRYVHHIVGLVQSTNIPKNNDTYGFNIQDNTLIISKLTLTDSQVVATIDLKEFVNSLILLKKSQDPDPNGFDTYFSNEEMSIIFKNKNITLKIYADTITFHEDDGIQVDSLTGLILFTPL